MTEPESRIVAELGRPETPEEKAHRLAEARRRRRANQTTKNLLLSLAASLGIVLLLVLVVVRPDPPALTVDHIASAAEAEASLGVPVVAPVIPPGWSANRAELTGSGGVTEWSIGFITESETFIGLVQGFDANPTWLRTTLRSPGDGEVVRVADREWREFDRREVTGIGLRAYALVTEAGTSTIVLYGTASTADFAVLAAEITAELEPAGD